MNEHPRVQTMRALQALSHDLRPLNAPRTLRMETDAQGRVVGVWRHGRLTPRRIVAVQDHWRIDDEWWREHAVVREYYELLLDDGTLLVAYHDLVADAWFEQRR
ncbi:MAG TPA: hypothetical protein VF909_08305 [Roseiflexaceae bacterium]